MTGLPSPGVPNKMREIDMEPPETPPTEKKTKPTHLIILAGLALLALHSFIPPRLSVGANPRPVGRASIFSDSFTSLNGTAVVATVRVGDGELIQASAGPAEFDMGAYLAEAVLLACITAGAVLVVNMNQKEETDPES